MTDIEDLSLGRAAQALPEISDCVVEIYNGGWTCEWPQDDEFSGWLGVGATPALAHAAMLDKLTDALTEWRLNNEDADGPVYEADDDR